MKPGEGRGAGGCASGAGAAVPCRRAGSHRGLRSLPQGTRGAAGTTLRSSRTGCRRGARAPGGPRSVAGRRALRRAPLQVSAAQPGGVGPRCSRAAATSAPRAAPALSASRRSVPRRCPSGPPPRGAGGAPVGSSRPRPERPRQPEPRPWRGGRRHGRGRSCRSCAGPAAGGAVRVPPRHAGEAPPLSARSRSRGRPSSGPPAGGAPPSAYRCFQKQVCDDIGRRLTALGDAWARGKLSAPVRRRMALLVRGEGRGSRALSGAARSGRGTPTGSPSPQSWSGAAGTQPTRSTAR